MPEVRTYFTSWQEWRDFTAGVETTCNVCGPYYYQERRMPQIGLSKPERRRLNRRTIPADVLLRGGRR